MGKNIIAFAAAVITAFAIAYSAHRDPLDHFTFRIGLYDTAEDEKAVEDTIKLFNKHFAALFNTGGDLSSLNYIPADNLIKRRIVQEINEWTSHDQILVYDKDVADIQGIEFLSPGRSVAVTREVWFLNVQNRQKRSEKSGVKANEIRVRYILQKIDRHWRIIECEVFGKDDPIPSLRTEGMWL